MSTTKIIISILALGIPLVLLTFFFIDEDIARYAIANDKTLSPIFDALSHGADSTYWLIVSSVLWLGWKFYKKHDFVNSNM